MANNSIGAYAQGGLNDIGAYEAIAFKFVLGTGAFAATIVVAQSSIGALIFQPILTSPIPDFSFESGDTVLIDISVYFADPTDQTLTFSAINLPAGLRMNRNTGIISGTVA